MLDVITLKKYKKYHRIKITHNSNKKELAEAVAHHFLQQHIDEDTVINAFVAHVKCMYTHPPHRIHSLKVVKQTKVRLRQ